jgi:alpha-glucuronidase
VYYHRADRNGIGFDRSSKGSNAVSQYAPEVAAQFNDLKTVPDEYLLWFHHVPWDYRMRSGRTVWEELVRHYTQGVDAVKQMRATWAGLEHQTIQNQEPERSRVRHRRCRASQRRRRQCLPQRGSPALRLERVERDEGVAEQDPRRSAEAEAQVAFPLPGLTP